MLLPEKIEIMTYKEKATAWFLVSMYMGGLVGIALPVHEDFVLLTPLNLLASLSLILWHHPKWDRPLSIFLLLCFFTGFLVELAGVQTGLIFGEYQYGEVLGWKIWGTPLIIGINWAMLVYASASSVNYFFGKLSSISKRLFPKALRTLSISP